MILAVMTQVNIESNLQNSNKLLILRNNFNFVRKSSFRLVNVVKIQIANVIPNLKENKTVKKFFLLPHDWIMEVCSHLLWVEAAELVHGKMGSQQWSVQCTKS